MVMMVAPQKINMEPKTEGLEDDFCFCNKNVSGSMLIFTLHHWFNEKWDVANSRPFKFPAIFERLWEKVKTLHNSMGSTVTVKVTISHGISWDAEVIEVI